MGYQKYKDALEAAIRSAGMTDPADNNPGIRRTAHNNSVFRHSLHAFLRIPRISVRYGCPA